RREESRCPARIPVPDSHEPGGYLKATLESQPHELARLLSDDSAARAAERLRGCARIFLVGTGTGYHGALAGQFMVRSVGMRSWRAYRRRSERHLGGATGCCRTCAASS